jgi:hypothetical protein
VVLERKVEGFERKGEENPIVGYQSRLTKPRIFVSVQESHWMIYSMRKKENLISCCEGEFLRKLARGDPCAECRRVIVSCLS